MSYPRRFQVLVVDDEPGMRETLVDILEQSGYVSAAADATSPSTSCRTATSTSW